MNKLAIYKNITYRILPKKIYFKLLYSLIYHRKINFKNPTRFSEKMYCLKIINKKKYCDLIAKCYDKYDVREYIAEKMDSELILNEVYDVYENAKDINFDKLPDRFVLKITQSCGFNIICPDKSKLDIQDTVKKLNKWLKKVNKTKNHAENSYYFTGKAKIVCEKFLVDETGKIPNDIRVYCFNGIPKLFVCDIGTTCEDGRHGSNIVRNVYDNEWNLLGVDLGRPRSCDIEVAKPENLSEICEVSKKLSADFEFVRVDLYNCNNKIYFGELTWIPMDGNCIISPNEYDDILGSWLSIPDMEDYI